MKDACYFMTREDNRIYEQSKLTLEMNELVRFQRKLMQYPMNWGIAKQISLRYSSYVSKTIAKAKENVERYKFCHDLRENVRFIDCMWKRRFADANTFLKKYDYEVVSGILNKTFKLNKDAVHAISLMASLGQIKITVGMLQYLLSAFDEDTEVKSGDGDTLYMCLDHDTLYL